MTVDARDAATVLGVIAGFDPRDSTSVDRPVPDYGPRLDEALNGLRIGLPREFFADGVDPAVAGAIREALRAYEKLGATLVELDLPNSRLGIPCYYVIAPAEASSNLARFDGVRYGYRADRYKDLNDMYCRTRGEGFGAEVKRRIMIGTYALSSGYYDAYYVKAQKLRRLIHDDFVRAFGQCDVIMGPTTPTTAFATGAKTDDPVAMYLNDIFTNSANLAGLPAASIPAGFDRQGLPVGLQIIGRYFDEARVLNVAHRFQQVTDWHRRVPAEFEQ